MHKNIGWGMAAAVCAWLCIAEATANPRANLGAARGNLGGGGASAARANIGAARGNVGGGNLNVNRGAAGASRPSVNPGAISRPSVNPGAISRPNVTRPSTSAPSLGGSVPINRPAINRPGGATPGGPSITRPDVSRPITRPEVGNIGANRPGGVTTLPGVIENRPGRPDLGSIVNRPGANLPDLGSRPITRPGLGDINRPDLGGVVNRPGANLPDLGSRPITRPGLGDINRPEVGGGLRPELPGGISRPDFGNLPIDRPSRDQVNDFLGIQRPDIDRPIIDRPGIDRPSIDRPSWNERPERPIIGDGDRNISIHNPPSWVDLDRDRIRDVGNRWGDAIQRRPDDLHRWTQRRPDRVARWRSWGNSVRFNWHISGHGVFGPIWWTNHRPVFCQWRHWHHWNRHSWSFWWQRPAFPVFSTWFVWRAPPVVWSQPIFYDFGPGGNVSFIDNRVFISGANVGSVEEFAQSAALLATVAPPESEAEVDAMEWLPLGAFAVSTSEDEGEPTRFVQLAVSQTGLISGAYFNEQTEVSQTVLGQVDPQTQRVAMRLGDNEDLVIETGLYNLTLDEAPVLVHYGPNKYEFFLLVRMEAPEEP